jgi:membrane protein DedA with SNARE-associated domain
MESLNSFFNQAGAWGPVFLALAAAVEYVFPPFPGDTVTLLGGLYSYLRGNCLPLVFAAIMAGTLLGSSADYALGRWIAQRYANRGSSSWLGRRIKPEQLDRWRQRFHQREIMWLLLNRFLPAIRGPVFLAAGMAQVPYRRVLFWGGLSAILWNCLLLFAGYALGGQAHKLEALLLNYGRYSWLAIGIFGVTVTAVVFWKKLRSA